MFKFLNSAHNTLSEKRKGFAITFEIMMVGLLVVFACLTIVYFTEVMNTQRFMYDLTASTCTAASRYGGDKSKAYEFQVRQDNPRSTASSISENANMYITAVNEVQASITHNNQEFIFVGGGDQGQFITVSPEPEGGYVWVELSFRFGHHGFGSIAEQLLPEGQTMTYRIYLPTLMQSGELLSGGE